MGYRVIDRETYYRKGVFRRFSEDCKCSLSMTARVDVTDLVAWSRARGRKFYLNFLYILCRALNSREDYRMDYRWQTDELICYDVIHPIQYVFHEDTETFTEVYSTYDPDYETFYAAALRDLLELPDGYLYLAPIVNWGKYRPEDGRLMMPVTVRMNHAVADGFLVANVFRLLEREMAAFVGERAGA